MPWLCSEVAARNAPHGGADFLGWRKTRQGATEIVYDDGVARRMIWRVATDQLFDPAVLAALPETATLDPAQADLPVFAELFSGGNLIWSIAGRALQRGICDAAQPTERDAALTENLALLVSCQAVNSQLTIAEQQYFALLVIQRAVKLQTGALALDQAGLVMQLGRADA